LNLMPDPSRDMPVLRPSFRHFLLAMRTRIKALAGLILSTSALVFAMYVWSTALQRGASSTLFPLFVSSLVLLIALGAASIHFVYFLHARIVARPGSLRKYGFVGSREYAIQDVGRVLRLSVTSIGPPGRIAIVLTPAGKSLFVMWMAYWDDDEFDSFWQSLGITVTGSYQDRMPYGSMFQAYPPAPDRPSST
jgi:hypothetical protein